MADHDEDLVASKTEGFKLGEKKTIAEYNELGMWASLSSICQIGLQLPRGVEAPLPTIGRESPRFLLLFFNYEQHVSSMFCN
jgi:hypothetical protein